MKKYRNLLDRKTSGVLDTIPFPRKLPDNFPIAKGTSEGCIVISVFDLNNGRFPNFIKYALNSIEVLIRNTDVIETNTPILLATNRNIVNYFPEGYDFPQENLLFHKDRPSNSPLNQEQFRIRHRFDYLLQLNDYKWSLHLDTDILVLGNNNKLCRRLKNAFNTGHQWLAVHYSGTNFIMYIRKDREIRLRVIKGILSLSDDELNTLAEKNRDMSVPTIISGLTAFRHDKFGQDYINFIENLPTTMWYDETILMLYALKNKIVISPFSKLVSRYYRMTWTLDSKPIWNFFDNKNGILFLEKSKILEQEKEIGRLIKEKTGLLVDLDLLK